MKYCKTTGLIRLFLFGIAVFINIINGFAQTAIEPVNWYQFSADGKECIIKNSNLPTPWLNRLGNDIFFTWITHNGYVESFLLDLIFFFRHLLVLSDPPSIALIVPLKNYLVPV